jgi:acetyl-CoA synthetase
MQKVFATKGAEWSPRESDRQRSRLLALVRRTGLADLDALQEAALKNPEWFWRAVVADLDITFSEPFCKVLDDSDGVAFPQWFVGGKLNVATLCGLRYADGSNSTKTAVVYEGDSGQCRTLSRAELGLEVRHFAANLKQMGVQRGDRVVLFLPVIPEAVVAFLGCAMIGAISVPAFSGFGAEALAARLRASDAVALVTADGTTRKGRQVPLKETADEALLSTPGVRHVVVARHMGTKVTMLKGRDIYWDSLDQNPDPVAVEAMDANDPLTILYTSGTTGAPKGIVHSHAGFAVKAAVDFAYGFDLHARDVVAWISDMGWMLGPLLILGGLQLGATIVLTEGVPDFPGPQRIWDIANRHEVTLQGFSPTAARHLMASGNGPQTEMSSIRAFASTGEPWDEKTWRWLFEDVGQGERPIINYSGGTETGGGILIAYPFLPMEKTGFNGPLPGMDVAVVDENGNDVVNQIGELAVRNTWPGMTHSFWQDRSRYLETYWQQFEGVWVHGDLASVDESGNWLLYGRSDDTMKVSGRRVGSAEIESSLLQDSRIAEAAVIGAPDELRGQRIVAFVVPTLQDADLDDISQTATRNVGRSFAPTVIFVKSLPKTKNGKIMRRTIRSRYLGLPTGDLSSLDASTSLEDIPIYEEGGEI